MMENSMKTTDALLQIANEKGQSDWARTTLIGASEYAEHLENELWALKRITASIPIDQLSTLCDAWRDGQCVVLSCKVGDTVYVLHDRKILHQKVWRVIVCHANDDIFAELSFNTGATEQCKYSGGFKFYFDDIGKIVFLTRAEAEAALAKEGEAL